MSEDLHARLAEVEAERDTWKSREAERTAYWHATIARAEAAEARLAEVEAERDRRHEYWLTAQARAYAAEDRLAAVEALCADSYGAYVGGDIKDDRDVVLVKDVLAAARGEGDRPAAHPFAPSPVADECIAWRAVPGDGSICGQPADHPIHCGEGDRD